MQKYLHRNVEHSVLQNLKVFPAVAILGARQCGKSTLVKNLAQKMTDFLYLDLQNPDDANKLSESTLFFAAKGNQLFVWMRYNIYPGYFQYCEAKLITTGEMDVLFY
jgi:uncharacterized protein